MSDGNEKKRPNANYKLSPDNIRPEDIVYHYNRERRLEKAPQIVQDLYKEQPRSRFFGGFFQTLLGNRPKKMLFGTIVILCIMIWLLSFLNVLGDTHELEGNLLTVHGEKLDGVALLTLRKTHKKDAFTRRNQIYTGPVDIAIVPLAKTQEEQIMHTANIFFHKIFFTFEPFQIESFPVPFGEDELVLAFQTEKKSMTMIIKLE